AALARPARPLVSAPARPGEHRLPPRRRGEDRRRPRPSRRPASFPSAARPAPGPALHLARGGRGRPPAAGAGGGGERLRRVAGRRLERAGAGAASGRRGGEALRPRAGTAPARRPRRPRRRSARAARRLPPHRCRLLVVGGPRGRAGEALRGLPRRAAVGGGRPPAPPAVLAERQERRLQGGEGERLWAFWSRQLAGAPQELELPADRPRP